MTREEAIKEAGINKIKEVECENVNFTCRLTDGTQYHGYDEFSATVDLDDGSLLAMYVYIDSNMIAKVEQLDELDWEHYIKEAEYEIC